MIALFHAAVLATPKHSPRPVYSQGHIVKELISVSCCPSVLLMDVFKTMVVIMSTTMVVININMVVLWLF